MTDVALVGNKNSCNIYILKCKFAQENLHSHRKESDEKLLVVTCNVIITYWIYH